MSIDIEQQATEPRPIHLPGRDAVLAVLEADLMGPVRTGDRVTVLDGKAHVNDAKGIYRPLIDDADGEEILVWERPSLRYGVGVLFPVGSTPPHALREQAQEPAVEAEQGTDARDPLVAKDALPNLEAAARRAGSDDTPGEDDFEAVDTTSQRPSSMAVTFALRRGSSGDVVVRARGGRYEQIPIVVKDGAPRVGWKRSAWAMERSFGVAGLDVERRTRFPESLDPEPHGDVLRTSLELTVRPVNDRPDVVYVTVALVNRSSSAADDRGNAFQCDLEIEVRDADGAAAVLPYPGPRWENLDAEERSNRLLYRDAPVFAVGHGCSADWGPLEDGGRTGLVRGLALPTFQVPSISPDVMIDGVELTTPMAPLAGLVGGDDGLGRCATILDAYASWIATTRAAGRALEPRLAEVAEMHLDRCDAVLASMREGLRLIEEDADVGRAFRFANHAILIQQLRSTGPTREITRMDAAKGRAVFDVPFPDPDLTAPVPGRGSWRAFQLAFLLSALPSVADAGHPDRDMVELIWFPTGGGKTEAYLGLVAFSAALRRLRDQDDVGTEVIMRYTLRLLTAQQFQRSSALIVAMDRLRAAEPDLYGDEPFRIGIWVGGGTTSNTKEQASRALQQMQKDPRKAENPFLVQRCPWCRARVGLIAIGKRYQILGYRKDKKRRSVVISCSDVECPFSRELPILVVDEDIYETPPTLVIGTVDKFAQLAWRPDARRLFGIGPDGDRVFGPPGLIIQDELHLISGPLGTMTGLFETVVDDLCTEDREGTPRRPKIVSSTATIRSYEEQVRALFARDRTRLFPPPGIDASDSFFARYATYADGSPREGRLYVGVHATNHRSMIASQVASMTALIQAPLMLDEDLRDPWWTDLIFFNNLRELGSSLSLIASNVPAQLRVFGNRFGFDYKQLRRLFDVRELTSRLRNDQVPKEISRLEAPYDPDGRPGSAVDICLASNIIEVGIDIDRLSLMLIVGQPKSAAQYIQVSGRVGRRWQERPGLVVTLLNPRRPRDRSHYERFREFHQSIYAAVEPASVTPFAPSAVDRGMPGLITAAVRSRVGPGDPSTPYRTPEELLERVSSSILRRVRFVDPEEEDRVAKVIARRLSELRNWGRTRWDDRDGSDDSEAMIVAASDDIAASPHVHHWRVMQSLRSVDAECEVMPIVFSEDDDAATEEVDA